MTILSEADRSIYQQEFAARLPAKLFDAHVHIWEKNAFPPDFQFATRAVGNRFGGEFPLSLWRQAMQELLPGQSVGMLCFGFPHDAADRGKVPAVSAAEEFASVLVSPADPAELLAQRLASSAAVGVKPYLNYAAAHYRKSASEVEVFDLLTDSQLELLNAAGLAVTLHIPRSGRFADPLNQHQMLALCQRYPRISFIFAHIGRAFYLRNILESNLDELAGCGNAYFDTAMVNHVDVLKYAFDHFPAERMLFGSDAPIALLHGKSVEVNHQYVYLMGEDYDVGTSIRDTEHAVQFTTFFYEQLRAILEATPEKSLENVLYHNAVNLFRSIAKHEDRSAALLSRAL
ncbi:MAG: amidohydrolase family protein [Lentisphaeria bacterium]